MKKFMRYIDTDTFNKIKKGECNIHGSTYVYYGNGNFKGNPEKLKELEDIVKTELAKMDNSYPKMTVCKIASQQSEFHARETMIKVMIPTAEIVKHKRRYHAL